MSKEKKTPLYTARRGCKAKDEKDKDIVEDYSDVLHRNIFTVDYPITLIGLGFFGPTKIEGGYSALYHVEWEVSKSIKPYYYNWWFPFKKSNVANPILASGSQCVDVKKDEVFQIHINKISIPANEGIEVAFALNGPKTAKMKTPSHSVPVKTRNRVVTFYFNEGSMQMPELYFIMEEDIEPV